MVSAAVAMHSELLGCSFLKAQLLPGKQQEHRTKQSCHTPMRCREKRATSPGQCSLQVFRVHGCRKNGNSAVDSICPSPLLPERMQLELARGSELINREAREDDEGAEGRPGEGR